MNSNGVAHFILLVVLLVLSAFFSGTETAFFSLSRAQLSRLKCSPRKRDKRLVQLLAHPRNILATLLLGNECVNVGISVLIASFLYETFAPAWGVRATAFVSVVVGTFVVLVFGEIIPKSFAIRSPLRWVPRIAIVFQWIDTFLKPARFLLAGLAGWVIRILGGEPQKETPLIMEEEFRHLVELGARVGAVEPQERELIYNVFDFSDTQVFEIMTPIESVFSLCLNQPFENILESLRKHSFSRIPVYEEVPGNFVGLLLMRDLFAFKRRREAGEVCSLQEILRPLVRVEGAKPLDVVFKKLRETRIHMAIVMRDEKPVGIITMGDILSALFGEMEKR